jgi:DNA mismatch repair protein MutL
VTVNERPVVAKIVPVALDQAFRSFTPERRYPVAALEILIEPAQVDVNVSPTKSEVRFRDESAVFSVIRHGIKDALLSHGMIPTMGQLDAANTAIQEATPQPGTRVFEAAVAAQRPLGEVGSYLMGGAAPLVGEDGQLRLASGSDIAGPYGSLIQDLRILGQFDATFILAENAVGLLLIDQHVAHERILFEYLQKTRGAGPAPTQPLLTPETVHLDRSVALLAVEKLDELRALGYEIDAFGATSFLVRGIPALTRARSPLAALKDTLDDLASGAPVGCMGFGADVFAMAACKMAVKAGDKLADAEMRKLIEDLAETENPYTCPHGRPITIVMPRGEVRRRFKR